MLMLIYADDALHLNIQTINNINLLDCIEVSVCWISFLNFTIK